MVSEFVFKYTKKGFWLYLTHVNGPSKNDISFWTTPKKMILESVDGTTAHQIFTPASTTTTTTTVTTTTTLACSFAPSHVFERDEYNFAL